MEQKRSQKESDYLPKRGNPLHETVYYKLGGTVYEVHTSCGGTEPLYDKMVRLIRSEAIAASADKEDKPQYNKDSNKLEVISGLLRSCMILLFYKDLKIRGLFNKLEGGILYV